jgi:tetrahydromethanopterin S-methyltransferase subunit B
MTLRFLEEYLIISEDLMSSIDPAVPLTASVPPQFEDSSNVYRLMINYQIGMSRMVISMSDAFGVSLVATISANLVLGVFAGISMKKLWTMISAM